MVLIFMSHFTPKELQGLARLERDMDQGRQPYVMWHGDRLSVPHAIMESLQLVNGQIISDPLFTAITQERIAHVEQQIIDQCSPADFDEDSQ